MIKRDVQDAWSRISGDTCETSITKDIAISKIKDDNSDHWAMSLDTLCLVFLSINQYFETPKILSCHLVLFSHYMLAKCNGQDFFLKTTKRACCLGLAQGSKVAWVSLPSLSWTPDLRLPHRKSSVDGDGRAASTCVCVWLHPALLPSLETLWCSCGVSWFHVDQWLTPARFPNYSAFQHSWVHPLPRIHVRWQTWCH